MFPTCCPSNSDMMSKCYRNRCPSLPKYAAEKQETNNGYTEQEILEVVMNNKDKLAEMLEMSEPETLPRYKVSGYKINKCIQLSHRLDAILKDFCQENNISQREIIEIGIIETLRKHGYQAEIKGLLGS